MSEDRTQAPSKRRRQEAKARGVAARSPELTAAVGLLAAVAMLGLWGGSLATSCVGLITAAFGSDAAALGFDGVVAALRTAALGVLLPLIGIAGGVVAAVVAAHQAQVGGMWAAGLIAPDPQRLWSPTGGDWAARAGRGAWGVAKAALFVAVTAWAILRERPALAMLGRSDVSAVATLSAALARRLLFALGLAALALGLVDYLLAHRRVEALLRTTPEEGREDAKAVDGDPAVRARRLRLAKSWRADPGEVLAGAVLVVTGPAGLAVVLGGEGPPGRVMVRASARGAPGTLFARSARSAGLSVVEAPALARHFASPSARSQPLPESLSRELAVVWPKRE